MSALLFSDDNRVSVSFWDPAAGETIRRGQYRLIGERLILDLGVGTESISCSFDPAGSLVLETERGKSGFRRPSDVPANMRNKVGNSILRVGEL